MTEDAMMFMEYIDNMTENEARRAKGMFPVNPNSHPSVKLNKYISVKLINGVTRYMQRKEIVGFCHCSLHIGSVSKSLLKEHDCVGKKCVYFERTNEKYWKAFDFQNSEKKKAKEKIKEERRKIKADTERWKELAQNLADMFNYNIRVTSVKKPTAKQRYIIYYISEWEYDDSSRFRDLIDTFAFTMEASRVELRHVKELDGSYAVI